MTNWTQAVAIASLAMLAGPPATAALVNLTGSELLTSPDASFPSIQPKVQGTSLVFEWGTSHGPPLMNLVRFRVNAGAALPADGDITITATWNITRLACVGFCAGGSDDWDPFFALSDGSTLTGFRISDENSGNLSAATDADQGATGTDRTPLTSEGGTGLVALGDSLSVALTFTMHDSGLTGRIQYLGIDRTWTFANTLGRTSSLALVLAQDNDSGERYQVSSLQVNDGLSIPEPTTYALIGIGALALGQTRRRWTSSLFR